MPIFVKNKRYSKGQGLRRAPPKWVFKKYYSIFRFGQLCNPSPSYLPAKTIFGLFFKHLHNVVSFKHLCPLPSCYISIHNIKSSRGQWSTMVLKVVVFYSRALPLKLPIPGAVPLFETGGLSCKYTAISRKVVGKSARDNPKRYCGWFFTVLQRNSWGGAIIRDGRSFE